jgi:hypothetical protein
LRVAPWRSGDLANIIAHPTRPALNATTIEFMPAHSFLYLSPLARFTTLRRLRTLDGGVAASSSWRSQPFARRACAVRPFRKPPRDSRVARRDQGKNIRAYPRTYRRHVFHPLGAFGELLVRFCRPLPYAQITADPISARVRRGTTPGRLTPCTLDGRACLGRLPVRGIRTSIVPSCTIRVVMHHSRIDEEFDTRSRRIIITRRK